VRIGLSPSTAVGRESGSRSMRILLETERGQSFFLFSTERFLQIREAFDNSVDCIELSGLLSPLVFPQPKYRFLTFLPQRGIVR
jgi:hypothetical protein